MGTVALERDEELGLGTLRACVKQRLLAELAVDVNGSCAEGRKAFEVRRRELFKIRVDLVVLMLTAESRCRIGSAGVALMFCRVLSPGSRQHRNTANRRRRAQPRPDDDHGDPTTTDV